MDQDVEPHGLGGDLLGVQVAAGRARTGARGLDEALDDLPEHLVIGTGADGRMQPDRHTVQRLKARGMTVESLPTGQAVRRYAELQPARTAAALHLTC